MAARIELRLQDNEYWWGGLVRHGDAMPFSTRSEYRAELYGNLVGNQGCPLLVSSCGRYVWSDEPFTFEFRSGVLRCGDLRAELQQGQAQEKTLRGAYLAACRKFFPPSGRMPHDLAFLAPQYNSWIEVQRYPTQEKVLKYARSILDAGMPPGIFMIDDFWYRNTGIWKWDLDAFPRPKEMIDQLHAMGFVVVLWIAPFVTSDNRQYWELKRKRFLLFRDDMHPEVFSWWNGYSAMLDLSNPEAFAWFQGELDALVSEFGVDGFKFDGGDPFTYAQSKEALQRSFAPRTPNSQCEDFARVGLKYSISEYRACWKLGGQHLLQRVRDKFHRWGQDGLADLIPTGLTQGLLGYPFTCPDMVGGGDAEDKGGFQQELFIRWAQASTFFPSIQYSLLPSWRLDAAHLELCMKLIQLRRQLAPEFLALARHAASTGEPIIRHMAYVFPDAGFETVGDQYMLGDKFLVAPVLTQGATARTIKFPAGKWVGDDGSVVQGPCEHKVEAPLARLPWYTLGGGKEL